MKLRGEDYIFMHATAKTIPGEVVAIGEVVAYCDGPQVLIVTPEGRRVWWRVELCEFEEPTDEEPELHNSN